MTPGASQPHTSSCIL